MGRNNQQRRKAKARARAQHRAARQGRAGYHASTPWPGAGGAALRERGETETALSWLRRLARLRAEGRSEEAEEAEFEVLATLGSPRGRSAVISHLLQRLTQETAWAWEHGWEPADVLRQASRRLGPDGVELAKDVVALSVSGYAHRTVSPRWHEQLAALGARVRWAPDTDPLTARSVEAGVAAVEVLLDADALLDLLTTLPPLEAVDAPPGQWHAPTSPPGSSSVPERLLQRVRALLAQAESTPYEAEAETFTAAAQSLMARHSIDQALLARAQPRGQKATPIARRLSVDRPYEAPKAALLDAVASANRCRTVWSQDLGFSTVVGHEVDLAATETLYLSLLVQATHAMTGHGPRATGGRSRTRSFRQSFLLAYSHRIGQRLRSAAEHEVSQRGAQVTSAPADASPGADLVVVLADRGREVDDAVRSMFPALVERRTAAARDAEGWAAGTYAAENATLFPGEAVEG